MALAAALLLALSALAVVASAQEGADGGLQIGVKFRPEDCEVKAQNGDYVGVHYVGKLTDGTEFDNSITRGEPIEFKLGAHQVIPGWERGILGMCVGEKRRLHIPPNLAYGDEGAGPIPGGATLVFDVELTRITAEPLADGGGEGYPGYEDYPPASEEDAEGEQQDMGGSAYGGSYEGGGDPEWT